MLQDQGLVYPGTVNLGRDLWGGGHIDCVDVGLVPMTAEEPFVVAVNSSYLLDQASAETGGGQDAEEAAEELQLGLLLHQAEAKI